MFGGLEQTQVMLVDSGADVSLAPRRLAEVLDLDWAKGKPMVLRGISPEPQCAVRGRLFETAVRVLPDGWPLRPPVCFAEGDVPLLAGRRGFLDRLQVELDGPRRLTRMTRR